MVASQVPAGPVRTYLVQWGRPSVVELFHFGLALVPASQMAALVPALAL